VVSQVPKGEAPIRQAQGRLWGAQLFIRPGFAKFALKETSGKSMVALERVTAQNLEVFKRVRLRALAEAPGAFGSTYAREAQFTDEEWRARVARWDGESGVGYLALNDGEACGIAGAFLDQKDPAQALLVSMWSDTAQRQQGVGRLLVDAVADWARRRGARSMRLTVVSNNEGAIRFYERLGFAKTGRTEPYPNDAALIEYEMAKGI
jgi:ribosomal protein S18 acetylase RimI-like enzyme